ncbi:hypothetical protein A5482_006650 [Cyanobacterium sp. IPPAS B-1200]|uniref:hypothetical protein n=1 Tax=Cyanobacterium sp. IPPAS B-1200 TaxID=1562720 RepID=UPI0008525E52|nr:hypothetical protein [Cyanobacterium sp. IPPAS B-1200]OEJ79248.1 hypothetical protein A5482_10245 [Cyanobacterium sp. IPPAS B-1200]
MSQFNLNNQGKTAIIIASITGLAVVGNNGLVNQLAGFLDNAMVSSAQAQMMPSITPDIRSRAMAVDMFLKQSGANSIAIEGQKAIALFDGGKQMPLPDGAYRHDSLIFTVQNGIVNSCDSCGNGGDDEPMWLQYCPGGKCPDEPEGEIIPQRGMERERDVRGTFEQISPGNLNNRTQPRITPNMTPNRIQPRITPNRTPNRTQPDSPSNQFPGDHF